MDEQKKARAFKRSDNVIPDFDYLFTKSEDRQGTSKSKFFRNLVRINLFSIILSTLIYIIQAAPTWVTPLLTADIINVATQALASAEGVTAEVWTKIAIDSGVIVVLILQNVVTTVWRYNIVSKMLRSTSAGIKSSVVRKLQSLSITYHKDMQTGKIQSKFLRDTDAIDAFLNLVMQNLIPSAVGLVASVVIALSKNWYVSLFFLLVIPCNVAVSFAFRKKISSRNHDYRLNAENMSMRLTTMLQMMSVTKAHGLEEKEISSVESSVKKLAGSGRKLDKTFAYFGSWTWVLNNLLSVLCLIFCVVLALQKMIGIGDIVLYQTLFGSISGYVTGLINSVPQIGTGFEALSSVSEIMSAKDVEVSIGKTKLPAIEGRVRFEDVCYKYPGSDQYVVQHLNLDVRPGECIAIVGPSGSGKSTIMNLIIGLLLPSSGELYIDDKSTKDLNLSEYRHFISVVPQNSILFAGSIRDNITYGLSGYTEEEFQNAVRMANLEEFVKDLPKGLDSDVGEHGDKLSGGQRQRVTIARALIRNPKILILDEATSALDNVSEYHVQKAISSSIRGRTTFIVAHRLSTIRDADRIIFMENGVAVESGTYEELMAKKGKFYELKNLNDLTQKTAEMQLE